MKLHKNQKGFGHVQSFIVLLVIVIIGLIGWLVYNGQQTKNDKESNSSINSFEECVAAGNPVMESYPEQCAANGKTFTNSKQKVDQPTDETSDWLLYEPPGKQYSVRLADGWKLNRYMKDSNLSTFNNNDIEYKKGNKAIVTEVDGGGDGAGGFFLDWRSELESEPEGVKSLAFKTDQDLQVTKYRYTETKDVEGIGLQKGGIGITYVIKKSDSSLVYVYYGFYPDRDTDRQDIIEKVIKTVSIN